MKKEKKRSKDNNTLDSNSGSCCPSSGKYYQKWQNTYLYAFFQVPCLFFYTHVTIRLILQTCDGCEKMSPSSLYHRVNIPLQRNLIHEILLQFFLDKEKSQLNDALRNVNQVYMLQSLRINKPITDAKFVITPDFILHLPHFRPL